MIFAREKNASDARVRIIIKCSCVSIVGAFLSISFNWVKFARYLHVKIEFVSIESNLIALYFPKVLCKYYKCSELKTEITPEKLFYHRIFLSGPTAFRDNTSLSPQKFG